MAKKKAAGKDFSKVKHKVGRKLKKVNETNTSFKAKTISVPGQRLGLAGTARDDASAPATRRRKQSMADLLRQTRHYQAKAKAGALQGIREIAETQMDLVTTPLPEVVTPILELLCDPDAKVRRLAVAALASLITHVPAERLRPFASLMLLHIYRTVTHLNLDVCIGGLDSLMSLLRRFPALFVGEAYQRLLGNCNAILSQSTQMANMEARAKLIASVLACLAEALTPQHTPAMGTPSTPTTARSQSYACTTGTLYGGRCAGFRRQGGALSGRTHGDAYNRAHATLSQAAAHGLTPDAGATLGPGVGVGSEEAGLYTNLLKLAKMYCTHVRGGGGGGGREGQVDEGQQEANVRALGLVLACLELLLRRSPACDGRRVAALIDDVATVFPWRSSGMGSGVGGKEVERNLPW